MEDTLRLDNVEITVRIGIVETSSGKKIRFGCVITNNSTEEVLLTSGNSSWCHLRLKDTSNNSFLETMGSTAKVTTRKLHPNQSMCTVRETLTPNEVRNKSNSDTGLEFTPNKEDKDMENQVYYLENFCFEDDGSKTTIATVDFVVDKIDIQPLQYKITPNKLDTWDSLKDEFNLIR